MQLKLSLHVETPLSEFHGMEVCVGKLDSSQLIEIRDLISTQAYLESNYYMEFYKYNSVFHKNGLLIVDGDLSENTISDEQNRSSDIFVDYDWSGFDDNVEVVNHVLEIKTGAYLISFRNESIYLYAEGVVSEHWNGAIQLHTHSLAIDDHSDAGFYFDILSDVVAEGVKWDRAYSDNEEGSGEIYGTHQFLVVNGKILMYARADEEYPFDDYASDSPIILDSNYENADEIINNLNSI